MSTEPEIADLSQKASRLSIERVNKAKRCIAKALLDLDELQRKLKADAKGQDIVCREAVNRSVHEVCQLMSKLNAAYEELSYACEKECWDVSFVGIDIVDAVRMLGIAVAPFYVDESLDSIDDFLFRLLDVQDKLAPALADLEVWFDD